MPENQAIVDKRIEAAKAVNKYSSYNLASAIESFIYGFESVIRQHFLKYNFKNDNDTTSASDLLTDFVKKAGPGKTVLLIDEYDYPLIHIPVTLKTKEERQCYIEAVLTSIKSFYATLKCKSEYFRKIFITGITCYKDACVFTVGNTIEDISLNPHFGSIVGFTREEIKIYFDEHIRYSASIHYGIEQQDLKDEHVDGLISELALWYDGYCFDEDHAHHVFSTISVLNFFASINARFKNYWYDLGGIPAVLKHNVKNMADDFLTINIEDKDFRLKVDRSQFFNQDSYYNMNPKVLLFQTGYLTLASPIREDVVMLKLPNE